MWRVYGKGKKKRERERGESLVLERIWFRENLPPNISNLGCYIHSRNETQKKRKEKRKREKKTETVASVASVWFGPIVTSRYLHVHVSLSPLSFSLSLCLSRALAQVNTPPFSFSGHEWLGRDWLRCRRRR